MNPTSTFDPRTAKDRAAEIVDQKLCGHDEDEMGPLDELHTRCFTALGDTADAVAATLAELGVTGTRPDRVEDDGEVYGDMHDLTGNALAVYFTEVCGATHASFGIDGGQLYWDGSNGVDEIGHEDVQLPQVLKDFQRGYENFAYPQLYRS